MKSSRGEAKKTNEVAPSQISETKVLEQKKRNKENGKTKSNLDIQVSRRHRDCHRHKKDLIN